MGKHDYLGDRAANFKLMADIKNWWRKRGYNVRVWLEKAIDPTNGTTIWVIRTNIVQPVSKARSNYVVE
jgi:hypothetical protein